MTDEKEEADRKAFSKFAPHLEEFLREIDAVPSDYMMTNWLIVSSSVDMKDPDLTSIACTPSQHTAFWQQSGLLHYALTRHESRIAEGGFGE